MSEDASLVEESSMGSPNPPEEHPEEQAVRPRSIKEWVLVSVVAAGVAVGVLLPIYVVYAIDQDADQVIMELERNRLALQEQAIRINVSTISCMLLIPPEQRNSFNLSECVRDGLEEFDDFIDEASTTTTP